MIELLTREMRSEERDAESLRLRAQRWALRIPKRNMISIGIGSYRRQKHADNINSVNV
jgi:hypothetical protein